MRAYVDKIWEVMPDVRFEEREGRLGGACLMSLGARA
jgi:hypothetical protein